MNAALFVAFLCIGVAYGASVKQTLGEGPHCPIKDPLTIEAGSIAVTIGELNEETMILDIKEGSEHGGAVATGLRHLRYKYTLNFITLTVQFEAGLEEEVCVRGDSYKAFGVVNAKPFSQELIPSGEFTGEGKFEACATNFGVQGSARVLVNLITGRVSLSKLEIKKFVFDKVAVNLEDFSVNGQAIDWDNWSSTFKPKFDGEFAAVGPQFIERARKAVNYHIKDLTLKDLLDLIGEGTTPAPCE